MRRLLATAALAATTFYAGNFYAGNFYGQLDKPSPYGPCPEDAAWIVMEGNDYPEGPNGGRSCITVDDIPAMLAEQYPARFGCTTDDECHEAGR